MSRYTMFIAGGALSLAVSGAAHAQSQYTATQSVTYEVKAVTQIAVSGSPSLTIQTATAGQNLTQATASGSYSLTSNEASSKITAEINTDMPSGLTLKVTLAAPSGGVGTSAGAVTLSSVAADVVTGISPVVANAKSIAYTLDAAVTAGIVGSASKTVTYTVVVAP